MRPLLLSYTTTVTSDIYTVTLDKGGRLRHLLIGVSCGVSGVSQHYATLRYRPVRYRFSAAPSTGETLSDILGVATQWSGQGGITFQNFIDVILPDHIQLTLSIDPVIAISGAISAWALLWIDDLPNEPSL